ncbi:MAG: response regulator, partial [Thiolinea sp.]
PSCAVNFRSAMFDIAQNQYRPDIMLVDYHLNHDEKGLDVMDRIREGLKHDIPGVLITADVDEQLMLEAKARGYKYLRKPVNPVLLRKVLIKVARKAG